MLAFLVISLFAGVRPGEFRKTVYEKRKRVTATLNWEDITRHGIAISAKLAKTGSPRLIPLTYPLLPWIELIAAYSEKKTGPIRPTKWREIWDGWRAKHWLDDKGCPIPWHMDQLRHTFGSYRVAITQNLNQVALEMGNSARVVYKHYWCWSTKESEAKDFWALDPPNAYGGVLKYDRLKKAEKELTSGFFSKY